MKVVEMWAELRATDGLAFWAAAPAVWAARRTSAHTSDHTRSGRMERNRKNPPHSGQRPVTHSPPVRCVDPLFPNHGERNGGRSKRVQGQIDSYFWVSAAVRASLGGIRKSEFEEENDKKRENKSTEKYQKCCVTQNHCSYKI